MLTSKLKGPGKRGPALERMCQEHVGNFENDLIQLVAVNTSLERRIEYNTRNKDAVSHSIFMYSFRGHLLTRN